jgi:ribulose-bisphosphate carboxylase large chain
MPVASGGVHPGMIKRLVEIAGMDLQMQAGGGVSGHPRGVRGGAKAMAQAVDAAAAGIELLEYAKDHVELAEALGKWGVA